MRWPPSTEAALQLPRSAGRIDRQALTIIRIGIGQSRTLIQCRVQYRARGVMAVSLVQTRVLSKSAWDTAA